MQHSQPERAGIGRNVFADSPQSPWTPDAPPGMVRIPLTCDLDHDVGACMASCGDFDNRRTLRSDTLVRIDGGAAQYAAFLVCVCAERTCVLINGEPVYASALPGAIDAMRAICDFLAPRVPAPASDPA